MKLALLSQCLFDQEAMNRSSPRSLLSSKYNSPRTLGRLGFALMSYYHALDYMFSMVFTYSPTHSIVCPQILPSPGHGPEVAAPSEAPTGVPVKATENLPSPLPLGDSTMVSLSSRGRATQNLLKGPTQVVSLAGTTRGLHMGGKSGSSARSTHSPGSLFQVSVIHLCFVLRKWASPV